MSIRELFGGAITARVPESLIDAAELPNAPPIPDTQELLLYPNYDVSVIVEILQGVDKQGEDAIRFHFDALAHDNSALDDKVEMVSPIAMEALDPGVVNPLALIGTQSVQRQRGAPPDEVRIAMGLFPVRKRISAHEEIENDLVISFNVSIKSANGRSAGEAGWDTAHRDFCAMVASLRIVNYELFVPKVTAP
ncbi:hypothetical protein HWV62_23144 [Athelia sp. TMB]|nr:hypothetical protein HWV62_4513 [Athelia sp. TMB]KAF7970744.1 hypothetical protein HWV62_23144 [Athelia sp. TMB]